METRSRTAAQRLAIEDGTRDPVNERVQRVEVALSEMGEQLGQVNQRLDQIFDSIGALVQTVAATQEATQQSAATVTRVQDVATQAATDVANLQTHLGEIGRVHELAQQTAAAVTQMRQQPTQPSSPPRSTPRANDDDVDMEMPTNRKLRKMETKPPIFEGDIDGVKLNSFIFQFESYYTFKGYDLSLDDETVGRELGQCVRKSAATWYETYVLNPTAVNTWSAMKISLEKNFKEPNFQQKMRNELLNFKQRGSYQGYVSKFQEKLRLVPLDPVFAKEIFLKGLSSNNLRKQILRKKPDSLDDVIAEGFSEVEIERIEGAKVPEPDTAPSARSTTNTASNSNRGSSPSKYRNQSGRANGPKKPKCPHCQRGFHDADECWVKYPEKRPKHLEHGQRGRNAKLSGSDKTDYKAKYFALIDRLVVEDAEANSQPLNE